MQTRRKRIRRVRRRYGFGYSGRTSDLVGAAVGGAIGVQAVKILANYT